MLRPRFLSFKLPWQRYLILGKIFSSLIEKCWKCIINPHFYWILELFWQCGIFCFWFLFLRYFIQITLIPIVGNPDRLVSNYSPLITCGSNFFMQFFYVSVINPLPIAMYWIMEYMMMQYFVWRWSTPYWIFNLP